MDFSEAVSEHLAWKQRLRRILLGRERRMIPERTEAVECVDCPLDHWLKTHGRIHGQDPVFREVQDQHRRSHDLAIQMVLGGEADRESMEMVFRIGQFHMCSRALLESLERLRRRHGLGGAPLCPLPLGFPREDLSSTPDGRA